MVSKNSLIDAKLKYKRRIFLAELGDFLVSEKLKKRKTGLQGRKAAKLSRPFQSPIAVFLKVFNLAEHFSKKKNFVAHLQNNNYKNKICMPSTLNNSKI